MGLMDRILGERIEEKSVDELGNNKRIEGKIIKLSDQGYGFITSRDIPFTRIFFHWTSLLQDTLNFKELEVGMEVEFEPNKVDGKGMRAIRIKVLGDKD